MFFAVCVGEANNPGPEARFGEDDDWGHDQAVEDELDFLQSDHYGYANGPEPDSDAPTDTPSADEGRCRRDEDLDEHVVGPWDIGIAEGEIAAWLEAESKLGIKRSVKGWLAAKPQAAGQGHGPLGRPA